MVKRNKMIPLFDLHFEQEEYNAVHSVLESKWISMGEKVNEFEKTFAQHLGVKHAVAVCNCTAALHLSLIISGVGPGDEVIVPSLTFVATANVVKMVGATPVFADISSLDDWTISFNDIQKKITKKTKAIIPVHYGGFVCHMKEIMNIANKYNIKIIEDSAHAHDSSRYKKAAGTFGDFGCFSFYSNKNITTAEGGMIVTDNDDYASRAKLLRSHGLTTSAYERDKGAKFYDVEEIGYNYRMSDINGALGIVQLKRLKDDTARRNELTKYYIEKLKDNKNIHIPFLKYEGESTCHIFPIYLKNGNRNKIKDRLLELNIQTTIHYLPVHKFKHYDTGVQLSNTDDVTSKELSLPIYYNLLNNDIDYICNCLNAIT